jgi:hypothetical protein
MNAFERKPEILWNFFSLKHEFNTKFLGFHYK